MDKVIEYTKCSHCSFRSTQEVEWRGNVKYFDCQDCGRWNAQAAETAPTRFERMETIKGDEFAVFSNFQF